MSNMFHCIQQIPNYQDTENEGPSVDLAQATAVNAAVRGIGMYKTSKNRRSPTIGPLTALPAPFPRNSMKVAKFLAPFMSVLMYRVSLDKKWIYDILNDSGVLEGDSFNRLLAEGMIEITNHCPVDLTHYRHDFMLHAPNEDRKDLLHPLGFIPMRNVEMNTVSIGLVHHADATAAVHDDNLKRLMRSGSWKHIDLATHRSPGSASEDFIRALHLGLQKTKELKATQTTNYPHLSLMVTETVETSSMDQFGIWNKLGQFNDDTPYPVQRTMSYLLQAFRTGRFYRDENHSLLLVEHDAEGKDVIKEICLVYWRVFYHPRHTDGPDEADYMKMRMMIEETNAIKVPSIASQLAGAKEIQKHLSNRDTLERFLPSEVFETEVDRTKIIDLILDCTAQQIDPLSDLSLLDRVIETDAKHWVLKPQREGGGNNLFGEQMVSKLKELKKTGAQGKSGFVLMELIKPPKHTSVVCDIQEDKVGLKTFEADSELGIFGSYVVDKTATETTKLDVDCPEIAYKVSLVQQGLVCCDNTGSLLRTKPSNVNEGGIHAGFGYLDTALLFKDAKWTEN